MNDGSYRDKVVLWREFSCAICARETFSLVLPYAQRVDEISSRPVDCGASFPGGSGEMELVCPRCYRIGSTYEENGADEHLDSVYDNRIDPLSDLFRMITESLHISYEQFVDLRASVFRNFRSVNSYYVDLDGVHSYSPVGDFDDRSGYVHGWHIHLRLEYVDGCVEGRYDLGLGRSPARGVSLGEFVDSCVPSSVPEVVEAVHREIHYAAAMLERLVVDFLYFIEDARVLGATFNRRLRDIKDNVSGEASRFVSPRCCLDDPHFWRHYY